MGVEFLHAFVAGLVQVFTWPTFGVPFPAGRLFAWLGYGA